jgi:hypothetical protein
MGRGEALILLSDGVVEAAGAGLTPEVVAAEVGRTGHGGTTATLEALQAAADKALGGPQSDDYTFVVLKRRAG